MANNNTFIMPLMANNTRIKVQLFGQWDEAIRVMQRISPTIKDAGTAAQMRAMNSLKDLVKKHLRNQDLPELTSKHYSSQYEAAKRRAGRDPRFLMSWLAYYNNIDVWKTGNFHMAFVGVKNGIKTKTLRGKNTKLDVARIAFIHEMGGKTIHKRPLWNPTIREMGGANGFKDAFVDYLHKELRKRRIPVTKFTKNRIFNSKIWH